MIILKLQPGKERSLLRRHPWIFSGAIQKSPAMPEDGEVVTVTDNRGKFLGRGHYQSGASIVVRILSFEDVEVDDTFWLQKLTNAFQYRQAVGVTGCGHTDCYRLVHGEGDGLPGLIIDIYHSTAVIQAHSAGMVKSLNSIAEAIKKLFGNTIKTIYSRPEEQIARTMGLIPSFLLGDASESTVLENGIKFRINVVTGQKTGFFLDQRENRALVGTISKGKSVLNCFSYTGGFSLYALAEGATEVHSVDVSQKAIDLLEENLSLNSFKGNHHAHCANVLEYLQNTEKDDFDIVIVDPPAFAKSLHKRHNAIQAYKRVNLAALRKVKPGGLLFSFSCSQVVGTQLFHDTIMAACIESGRTVRVVRQLSQGADHPVNMYHPEGHYLKGLMLHIEN